MEKGFILSKKITEKLPKQEVDFDIDNNNSWFSDRIVTRIDYLRLLDNELWFFVHFFVDEKKIKNIETFWKEYDKQNIKPEIFLKQKKIYPIFFQKKKNKNYNMLIPNIELTNDLQIL